MNLTLSTFIKTYDNALSEEFCQKVCDKFDKDDRLTPGRLGNVPRVDKRTKNTTDLGVTSLKDAGWGEEDKVFFDSLDKHIQIYWNDIEKLKGKTPLASGTEVTDKGYQIMRYEPDGYFHWHHDFIVEKDKGARIITFIWYLNNVNKEGYTEFCDGTIITPKTGKLLIFPADWMYIHRGRPPKIGRKYICTGWMYLQNNL